MAKWWVPLALLLHGVAAHYTPTWAVHVPEGREAADAVAAEHGFINLGEKPAVSKVTQVKYLNPIRKKYQCLGERFYKTKLYNFVWNSANEARKQHRLIECRNQVRGV
ncbi:Furin-like protease 1, isoform 1-CRR [Papilio machaon]|uniref:Furin-like protease 1, isoform 1-CRR n=1 Tax=Papilio machaon TaxID=76193 RepID=A0A194RPE0_PAPMA|nr:Furin-like protease 1, isoform 1-CRR [Papilio machaon]